MTATDPAPAPADWDTPLEPQPDQPPPPHAENDLSRRERARFEQQLADRDDENRRLRVENLVVGKGIDTSKGLGKFFVEGYKGDPTAEAVEAALTETELLKPPGETSPPAPEGPEISEGERRQTEERRLAAAGAVPDAGAPSEHPGDIARRVAQQVMENGGNEETAIAHGLDALANAAVHGDQRAIYEPGKIDPRRPDLGW